MNLALLLSMVPWALPATPAQDSWSRFRGPNGSGRIEAQAIPSDFGDSESLAWRLELPPGHSSPVLDAERVYLTAFEGERLLTVAVDRASGEVAWQVEAPRNSVTKVDGRNNAASPSPVVDGGRIFVFFPDFGLLAYDVQGKELWRRELGPFENLYGMGASPIVVDAHVILASDQNRGSYVAAFSAVDGSELWRAERPWAKSGHCTPVLREASDGNRDVILPGSFYLDAYVPGTGERRWWTPGLSFEMKSVPVLYEDLVVVNGYGSPMNDPGQNVEIPTFAEVIGGGDGDGDGLVSQEEMPASRASAWFSFVDLDGNAKLDEGEWSYLADALASTNGMLAFRPEGEGQLDAALVWSEHRSIPQLPSPLIHDGLLYLLNDSGGIIRTFRPDTGELVSQARIEQAVDAYYASPVGDGGKVLLVSEAGFVVVLPGGGSLDPVSVHDLSERCYATPALAEDGTYLRSESALYRFAPIADAR